MYTEDAYRRIIKHKSNICILKFIDSGLLRTLDKMCFLSDTDIFSYLKQFPFSRVDYYDLFERNKNRRMQISMERNSPAYMIFDIYKKIINKYNI